MTANFLERYSASLYSCNDKLFEVYPLIMDDFKLLKTADEVIEVLGGKSAFQTLTGASPQTIWNWLNAGSFPASTFVVMTTALAEKRMRAPASLWRMREPIAS